MKKRIHCTCALFAIIMRYTSRMQVVHPLKQWSSRRWTWMDRTTEKPEDPIPIVYFLWSTRCLSYNTGTEPFPPAQQDTTTMGTSDVSPPSVGVHANMTGERSSGDNQSKFPHLPPSKAVVFKYWTLVSDDLIPHVRNSGQYTATFKYNIEATGKVCGVERNLIHRKDKAVSTTNLIGLLVDSEIVLSTQDLTWIQGST